MPRSKHLIAAAAVCWMTAALALAPRGAAAAGINLSWDACGAAGAELETFACNTNSGPPSVMVASFTPPPGIGQYLGLTSELRIAATTLPAWWKHGSGQCRGTGGLSVDFASPPSGGCLTPWTGSQVGGFVYQVDGYGPNTARLALSGAVPIDQAASLSASSEYEAFRVNVQPTLSTGAGACAGCAQPVRITLEQIQLFQPPDAANDPVLTTPLLRNSVLWQASPGDPPTLASVTPGAGAPGQVVTIDGTAFTGTSFVRFGGSPAAFTVVNDTRITATVPPNAYSGFVTVVTPLGTATSPTAFTVSPRVADFLPKQAPIGAPVQIRGANFGNASAVLFNGVAASFGIVDDSTLVANAVPAGATSGPISVTNPGGTAVSDSLFRVGPASGALNLAWDDCSAAGTPVKTFACNTNSGPAFTLVGSFVPPPGVDALLGLNADLGVHAALLPDWWRIGPSGCRGNVLSGSFGFTTGPSTCDDPWQGLAGGSASYTVGHYGPESARIHVSGSMPESNAIAVSPYQEYYGFKVLLGRARTVSDGACADCVVPVRLTLHQIQLVQRASVGSNPVITLPYQSNTAYWQAVPGPLPEIDALTPTAGAPGTLVTLTGQHFAGATEVKLGPQLTTFTIDSDTQIRSTVPVGARTHPFTIRTPQGVGGSDSLFIVTPRITAVVPGQAPVGFTIAVRGENFTRTTAVHFNGVAASFTAENDSLIRATVPPGATTGPMSVTNAGGTATAGFVVGPLPPGSVNLSWNDCGLAGTAIQTFACNATMGPAVAVASFDPPPDVDELVGLAGQIRVSAFGALPDWWRHGAGQCRGTTALTASLDFTGASGACVDPWAGHGVTASVTYVIDAYGPGTARLLVNGGIATGSPVAVDPGTEYNGFKVVIARTSASAASCAGCATPVSLELEQIQLLQATGGYDPVLADPKDRVRILWQDEPGPPPEIASFTPAGGSGGTVVTIEGTSFTAASHVRFNGASAAFTLVDDGEIHATAPAGVRTGPIQVTTPRGQDTSDSLFLATPMIQFFVPRQGPVGTSVALRGVNFTRVASVAFDGVPATFTIVSDSLLRAEVPASATTGPIEVAHAGGAATSAIDFVVGPLLDGAVNLSWNECGTAGIATLTYDCGTNLGTAPLVASFTPSPDVHEMIGLTGEVRVHSTAALPDWWKHGAGQCRGTSALSTSVNFLPGSFPACTNPWAGRSATAAHTYSIGHYGPNSARILVNAGVPASQRFALSPAQEYYAFMVNVARTSSSCAGCALPVGLALESIQLLQSADLQYDPVLIDERDRKAAFWQAEPGPAPSIASFTPAAGAPGTLVTITGDHFTGATDVRFGALGAVFEVLSDENVRATVPANALTAPLSVSTIQGAGTSAGSFVVAPRIVSFAPRQAPAGYSITIRGQNFGGTSDVEFGGGADAAAFTVVSETELRATVPGAAVSGPIRVVNPGGAALSAEDFVVGPLPPGFINLAWNDCGPAGSGIQTFACNTNTAGPFTLVGSFVPPDGVTEMFGLSGEIRVVSNSTVLPDWWKHGAGQCRSTTGLTTSFDFTGGPSTCEDFWMGQASGGHTYEIGFGGANAARLVVTGSIAYDQRRPADPGAEYYAFKVNLTAANTTSCSGCNQGLRLTLRQIQLFQAKPLNFDPVITTPYHSRDAYWQFVPGPAPEVVDFTPRAGAPGIPVTIFGANFTGTTGVRFGPASAVFSVTSDGRIDCTLPSSAITGPIEITTLQGATLTDSIFVVAPDITGFSPFQAPVGHEIRLFGINFLRTTAVTFNGTPASSFRVLDNSDLRATVPSGATNGPIRVENPGGFDVSTNSFTIGPIGIGQGINLSWSDCGTAGTQNTTFACNTNTGAPFTAIASFVPPQALPEFLGLTSQIDLRSQTPTLPEWWKHGSGFCRGTTGLAVSFDFTAGPFTCIDFFAGAAAGGFVYEYPAGSTSDRSRIRVSMAVPFDNRGQVDEQVEYYAYKVNVLRGKTTSTGSCSGCDVPMCLYLDNIQLYQPPERANDPILSNPSDRNFVTWQGATLCATSTPVQVSNVTAEATPTSARIVWQLEGIETATVQRSENGERWEALATVIPDGQRRIVFDDFDVVPGATYAYRLGFQGDAGMVFAGETEVRIPGLAGNLALLGVRDEASGVAVSFTLPVTGDAAVAIFDLGGRRLAERRLEGLKAGEHEIRVAGPRPLTPGVYFARLVQQGASASRRFVVVK